MNMNNNAVKFGSIMGALMLMAIAAPSAHAVFHELTYYDFENGSVFPLASDGGEQLTHISFTAASFPGGNLTVDGTVATPVGTNLNALTPSTVHALNARGNSTDPAAAYCFMLGGLTTTGLTDVTLSFALKSEGSANPGQFTTLDLLYSTTGIGGAYTSFATDTTLRNNTAYTTLSFDVSALTGGAVNGISGGNLFFEFCFSGSTNNGAGNNTLIDNVQVTALPEPSSYIGGLLGIVGLCWYQRRRLTRLLSLRPT